MASGHVDRILRIHPDERQDLPHDRASIALEVLVQMNLNLLPGECVEEALQVRRVPSHGRKRDKWVLGVLCRAEPAQEHAGRVAPECLQITLPQPLDRMPQDEDKSRRRYLRPDRSSRAGQLEIPHARLTHGNFAAHPPK